MTLLRSGVVLFVSVTILSIAMGVGLLYISGFGTMDWSRAFDEYLAPILYFATVSLATCIVLVVLAWRGRQQPLGDGVVSINLLVLGYFFVQAVWSASDGPSYPDSTPMYGWMVAGFYLACLVPAHVLTYLVLRRTPLLRGLAPSPKAKGPAEASPQ